MDIDWYIKLWLLLVLLLTSAFFSGSEVALFSLDKFKIKDLQSRYPLIGDYIFNLLEFPKRLLVTILLSNTVAVVATAIVSVDLSLDVARVYGISRDMALLSQIAVVTVLVLIPGEILPKVLAAKYPVTYAKFAGIPLYWISVLIYPAAKIITDIVKTLSSKIRPDRGRAIILTGERTELVDLGIDKGSIAEEGQELIEGLVSFRTVTAREVMTPRVDIAAVSIDTELDELMKLISESGHSRLPLFKNNLDEIAGIIYAKDLLPYLKNEAVSKTLSLEKIARKALFVPETKLISELMREFQEKKMHLGIVVDEYGGTAGLISLEDILEEIVGEIRDEYDKDENKITKTGESAYMVLGKTSIDDINEVLDLEIFNEHEDYDTIGGFILNYSGSIPVEGYSFTYGDVKFTVKEIVNKRVKKVLVELPVNKTETEL